MSEEMQPEPGAPPQPVFGISLAALAAIVEGNRAVLGLPPQEPRNAHECTLHCGVAYHPDRVTVGLIEAYERSSRPGVIHHASKDDDQQQRAPELAAKPGLRVDWARVSEAVADRERERDRLREGIIALAARLYESAAATRPSRKSQIEDECAIALRQLLEGE